MALEVGDKAPDFRVNDQDGTPVKLSDFKGKKVVLYFYPKDMTPGCTAEACSLRDNYKLLMKQGYEVLGVSTDTFFALKAWGDQQKLNFPLLSDYNKDVIRTYDVVNPDMIGLKDIAKRAVFVIDRSGAVRHREVLDDARNEPNYDAVKKALASL